MFYILINFFDNGLTHHPQGVLIIFLTEIKEIKKVVKLTNIQKL